LGGGRQPGVVTTLGAELRQVGASRRALGCVAWFAVGFHSGRNARKRVVGKCRDARVPPSGVRVVFRHVTAIDDPENEGCHLAPPSGGARGDGISRRRSCGSPSGGTLKYVRETNFLEGSEHFFLSRGLAGNTSARAILTWPGHTGMSSRVFALRLGTSRDFEGKRCERTLRGRRTASERYGGGDVRPVG
jgi:hypothetical protein